MSEERSSGGSGGIGFFGLLFIVFVTLKLTGYIDWSWWWVAAPLWGPIAFALAVLASIYAGVAVAFACVTATAVVLAWWNGREDRNG